MRNPARFNDLFAGSVRMSKADVLGDCTVEEKVVLQNDAELISIVFQPHRCQIASIHSQAAFKRTIESHHQTDQSALARSARTDKSSRRARRRVEGNIFQDVHALVVFKADIVESNFADDLRTM